MEIKLSKRLALCAGFVCPGDRVADIGCDHGYLSIYLIQKNIAASVIASDVVEGPLQSAVRNAAKYGVSNKVRFYLSDGVQSIPRDFDTLICAGMGADTMVSILENGRWLRSREYRLILQCQSKTPMLRRYLTQTGWRITEESVVRDGRFLYTVMEVTWEPGHTLSPGECYFPPALLENPGPELPEYYRQTVSRLRRAVQGQKEQADPEMVAALQELLALPEDPALRWLRAENF